MDCPHTASPLKVQLERITLDRIQGSHDSWLVVSFFKADMEVRDGRTHPVEMRERAVCLVEQGSAHTEAARWLCVSIKFVNDMVPVSYTHLTLPTICSV